MPEKWTGRLIGRMHNERVTYEELAAEMRCTKSYVGMILNGARSPAGARERMESALRAILEERNKGSKL